MANRPKAFDEPPGAAIAHARADGGVAIDHPAPAARLVIGMRGPAGEVPFTRPLAQHDALIHLTATGLEPVMEGQAEFLARVADQVVPAGSAWVTVSGGNLAALADRDFRDAWRLAGSLVAIDLAAARVLRLGQLRAARDQALQALDGPTLRAQEHGKAALHAELLALKQRLRDLPAEVAPALDAAEDVVALRAVGADLLAEASAAVRT